MANRVHRRLKVIAFNANGISKQRYELSKQQQVLHIDVALFSETYLTPYERFYIRYYHFRQIDQQLGRKGRTAVAVKKGILHKHVDLPPLISRETLQKKDPNSGLTMWLSAMTTPLRMMRWVHEFLDNKSIKNGPSTLFTDLAPWDFVLFHN
jgi:hypothetical protein